ncbi:GNAT family N-acetyltransferase [Luteimonas sp. 3794]|uniref:GNAT family N-acetyltransferase n=1 Tax=Luteimonas sp. 3794 TaxID=2817730 RepID=UPI00285B0FDD|nr:GNAT family N-acetyltransferase [Luteimonas sp. 3794]MDR6992493.1 GNAT superfamily N-acetyltransferase [Luteimonas sp. 3794]
MSAAAPPVSRLATLEDLPQILEMMRAFYAEDRLHFHEHATPQAVSQLLSEPGCGALLLLGADGRDGYMALTRGFSLEQGGHHALLDELYIAPAARGRGLGAQALALASTLAHEWGVAMLRLEVHHHNPRAKALYLRAGFVDGQRDTLGLALAPRS